MTCLELSYQADIVVLRVCINVCGEVTTREARETSEIALNLDELGLPIQSPSDKRKPCRHYDCDLCAPYHRIKRRLRDCPQPSKMFPKEASLYSNVRSTKQIKTPGGLCHTKRTAASASSHFLPDVATRATGHSRKHANRMGRGDVVASCEPEGLRG